MIDPRRLPMVDVVEAQRRLAGDAMAAGNGSVAAALLVDVREPQEFVAVRAEDVVLMPLSTWMLRYRELPQDRPLLIICRSGARSGQATAFLLANGWADVANVAGGMEAWQRAGLPVRSGPPAPGEGDLPR